MTKDGLIKLKANIFTLKIYCSKNSIYDFGSWHLSHLKIPLPIVVEWSRRHSKWKAFWHKVHTSKVPCGRMNEWKMKRLKPEEYARMVYLTNLHVPVQHWHFKQLWHFQIGILAFAFSNFAFRKQPKWLVVSQLVHLTKFALLICFEQRTQTAPLAFTMACGKSLTKIFASSRTADEPLLRIKSMTIGRGIWTMGMAAGAIFWLGAILSGGNWNLYFSTSHLAVVIWLMRCWIRSLHLVNKS